MTVALSCVCVWKMVSVRLLSRASAFVAMRVTGYKARRKKERTRIMMRAGFRDYAAPLIPADNMLDLASGLRDSARDQSLTDVAPRSYGRRWRKCVCQGS